MRARLHLPHLSRRRPLGPTRRLATTHFSKNQTTTGATTTRFGFDAHPAVASTTQLVPVLSSARNFSSVSKTTESSIAEAVASDGFDDEEEDDDEYDYYDDNHYATKSRHDAPENDKKDHSKSRIWMDPESSLERRVDRFVNQPLGTIHHLDIKLTSVDLIKECGKENSFVGMKKAQDILDRLIEEKRYVNADLSPEEAFKRVVVPDRPFKMVMYGWANLSQKVELSPQRMREVLDSMIEEAEYDKRINEKMNGLQIRYADSDDDDGGSEKKEQTVDLFEGLSCEPTVDIYNTLLQGLSQAATRSIQAAIEAEHVLKRMDKMNRNRGWHTKPNTRSYSLVLNGYTKSRHPTGGDRADAVLRKMIERYAYEREDYFDEYGVEYDMLQPDNNKRMIVTPDTIAYTTVIQAHVNSGSSESAGKALLLLNELIDSDNPSLEPDAFAFANTINAFSKMAAQKKSPADRVEAAECAEDILWMMVEAMKKDPDTNQLSGSVVPFNACLNAWAQSFTPESPLRAESLLHRMMDPELQEIAKIHPNTVSFNTCMQAWAKACKFEESASPEKAEELLNLLIQLSDENVGDGLNLRPDLRSFVTVMNAYALSGKEDSVLQIRRLLSILLEGRGKYFGTSNKDGINASPFTILLKAAAKTKASNANSVEYNLENFAFGSLDDDGNDDDTQGEPNEDPYSIALKTYSELLNDKHGLGVSPDHFVFAAMLAVIGKHTSSESIERRQRIEEVFHDARQAGQVSSLVIKALQSACPNEIVLRDLLGLRGHASIESVNIFPRPWTARVTPEFRRVNSRNEHFQKQSKHFRDLKKKKGGKKPIQSERRQPKQKQS